MKIRILRDCIVGGVKQRKRSVLHASDEDARLLIKMEAAEPVSAATAERRVTKFQGIVLDRREREAEQRRVEEEIAKAEKEIAAAEAEAAQDETRENRAVGLEGEGSEPIPQKRAGGKR